MRMLLTVCAIVALGLALAVLIGGEQVWALDLITLTYSDPLTFALPDGTNRASGAAWAPGALVPEPSTYALLLMAAGAAGFITRRRRRS